MKFESELHMFKFMKEAFYSAALSDILDEHGYPNCAVSPFSGIRPLFEDAIVVGRARTMLNAPQKTGRDDPYKLAIELMDSLQPGDVPVACSIEPIETGIMGELSATAMRSRGAMGCLVDGFTRDCRKLIEMGFPVFARGSSPIDTTDRVAVIEYDEPVKFGNRDLTTGLIVFADLDGIIFIPKEVEMEIIEETARRLKTENNVRKELSGGKKVRDVWDKYRVM